MAAIIFKAALDASGALEVQPAPLAHALLGDYQPISAIPYRCQNT